MANLRLGYNTASLEVHGSEDEGPEYLGLPSTPQALQLGYRFLHYPICLRLLHHPMASLHHNLWDYGLQEMART